MPIDITITVSDASAIRVLEAFNGLAGKDMCVWADFGDSKLDWKFKFDPKSGGETNKQFATRVVREIVKATIRVYDFSQDTVRYKTEVDAVLPPNQDVPDDIVT